MGRGILLYRVFLLIYKMTVLWEPAGLTKAFTFIFARLRRLLQEKQSWIKKCCYLSMPAREKVR